MNRFQYRAAEHYIRHLNIPAGDLRISITAQCNMRCGYCHNEGQGGFRSKMMPVEQVLHIVRNSMRYGVQKVRLTGGEPLLHPNINEICSLLREKLHVQNIGINTNGILGGKLKKIFSEQNLDVAVIGLDYFDKQTSKASPTVKSSKEILKLVEVLKRKNLNVQIAAVYNGDLQDSLMLTQWCLSRGVLLKFLEISNKEVARSSQEEFVNLFEQVVAKFSLKIGITTDLREMYCVDSKGNKILFFHSHCRVRQCVECSKMHMRVTVEGNAKPCLLRSDTEYSIINDNFDHSMRLAIANLGVPPEEARVEGTRSTNL